MSRERKARSVATELPASGGRRAGVALLAEVGEHLLLGLGEGDAGLELVEQPGLLVHVPHEVAHLLQRLGRRLDDEVDAVAEHVEVEVGHERGHLDECVGPEVETGHLAVDPDESFVHEGHPTVTRRKRLGLRVPSDPSASPQTAVLPS